MSVFSSLNRGGTPQAAASNAYQPSYQSSFSSPASNRQSYASAYGQRPSESSFSNSAQQPQQSMYRSGQFGSRRPFGTKEVKEEYKEKEEFYESDSDNDQDEGRVKGSVKKVIKATRLDKAADMVKRTVCKLPIWVYISVLLVAAVSIGYCIFKRVLSQSHIKGLSRNKDGRRRNYLIEVGDGEPGPVDKRIKLGHGHPTVVQRVAVETKAEAEQITKDVEASRPVLVQEPAPVVEVVLDKTASDAPVAGVEVAAPALVDAPMQTLGSIVTSQSDKVRDWLKFNEANEVSA